MRTRKKLKRNCRFSFVCGSENGLMVKSPASWPTFRYDPPKIVVSDWKLPPISKMKVSGRYFCAFCSRKLQKYDFPFLPFPACFFLQLSGSGNKEAGTVKGTERRPKEGGRA
jgi:hypothetical protein